MKNVVLLLFILQVMFVYAQQLTPIELLTQPKRNKLALSGVGGLNMNDKCFVCGASSAQLAIDWNVLNFARLTKKGNDFFTTHAILFKANPIATSRMLNLDSIYAKKIAMVDNEHLVHIGYRFKQLVGFESSDSENADFYSSPYVDFMYTPYNIKLRDSTNAQFNTLNLNAGYQFGFMQGKSKIGDFGIILSMQGNYIQVFENSSFVGSFDKTFPSNSNLSKSYAGFGGKIVFLLNDFAFFFELRKYYGLDNSTILNGLNDTPIMSFGFTATGTALRINGEKD